MDPGSALTTGLKGAEYAVKSWGLLRRLMSGSVVITYPETKSAHSSEWVRIEGTHSRVAGGKYHYFQAKR
jgi:hypothetical protein